MFIKSGKLWINLANIVSVEEIDTPESTGLIVKYGQDDYCKLILPKDPESGLWSKVKRLFIVRDAKYTEIESLITKVRNYVS